MNDKMKKMEGPLSVVFSKIPVPQDPDKRREMALALTTASASLSNEKLSGLALFLDVAGTYELFSNVLENAAEVQKAGDDMARHKALNKMPD